MEREEKKKAAKKERDVSKVELLGKSSRRGKAMED